MMIYTRLSRCSFEENNDFIKNFQIQENNRFFMLFYVFCIYKDLIMHGQISFSLHEGKESG